MDRKAHWQKVYETKAADAVSWCQETPTVSARLPEAAGISPLGENARRVNWIEAGNRRLARAARGHLARSRRVSLLTAAVEHRSP